MKQATRFPVQQGWKILLMDMGLNTADVLTLAELPADLFARPNAMLTTDEYFKLWAGLEKVASDRELALDIGQSISVEAFDAPIFASLCSPNLNVALQRLSQFKKLVCPMILHVEKTEQFTRTCAVWSNSNDTLPYCLTMVEPVFLTQLARIATRQHIVPTEVMLTRQPRNIELYETYFGVHVTLGDKDQITFSAQDANLPFLTENIGMWAYFEPELKKRLSDVDVQASMYQRVKSILLELLPSGQSSIEQVANKLAMSKRTMQRRLKQEGVNYQTVLNSTREELAQHYLSHSAMATSEISFLLGFQDTNSFIRAFNHWTGKTPMQFRKQM